MSPKSKRHKKKEEIKCGKNGKSENTSGHKIAGTSESYSNLFTSDENTELNAIFKISDVSEVPAVVGATVLNKLDVLAKLLKQGNDINELGPNETTALMWAVKFKNLEALEFLLSHGADPTIKNGSGDHILLVALENKLWDEIAFITLWNTVRNIGFIDLDYTSKAGHSMLHITVRREWMEVMGLLIAENANMNVMNLNGVTPLMLACFRNNLEMVDALLVAGANVLKEDNRGCLPLCYAISSVVLKNAKAPHNVVDRILFEFSKYNFSFRNYLKKCIKMITNFYKKTKSSTQTTDMLLHVMIFAVRQMKHGFKILLELGIFDEIQKVTEKHTEDVETCKAMLLLLNETASYNESCTSYLLSTEKDMVEKFFATNSAEVCLAIMKKFENSERNKWLPSLAIFPLTQICATNEFGIKWLEANYKRLPKHYEKYVDNFHMCIHQGDETHTKAVKHKLKLFKDRCDELKKSSLEFENDERNFDFETGDERSLNSRQTSKKSKRRAKALKAKIAKLRGADVTKRYIRGKMIMEQKSSCSIGIMESASSNFEPVTELKPVIQTKLRHMEEKNIVQEIKKTILDLPKPVIEASKCGTSKSGDLDWLSNTTWNTQNYYEDNQETVQVFYQKSDSLEQKYYTPRMLDSATEYLKKLLQKIISVYQDHWKRDQELKYIRVPRCHGDTFNKEEPKTSKGHTKETPQPSEIKCLAHLENEFESLLLTIHSQARKNMPLCQTAINKLENLLLTHEIRGKTIIAESLSSDCYKMYYCPFTEDVYEKGSGDMDHIFTRNFKEFLLNKSEEPVQPDTKKSQYKSTQDSSHCKDVIILSRSDFRYKSANEKKAQKKTMDNAYHLLPSILSIFEEDDFVPDETLPICAKSSTTSQDCELNSKSEYSEVLIKALLNQHKQTCIHSSMHHRWCAMIQSLRNSGDLHKFENCGLRVSAKENNVEFIISRTGTFSYVELALDKDNRPFALKRVPRDTETCRSLKVLINPLLGLRNTHILHYYACDYEDDELILATPLCEYNLGQYLMFVKHTKKPLLAPTDLISQFLAGLMYLHHCRGPVVHGNLKPSNIFVDFSGVIRIAEFGIHEALFLGKEAPDSSVIWFSQETYRIYRESSTIECTTSSDIQVAGMLLHFIWTGGAHPFGRETKEIMKNLEKSSFKLLTRDPDLLDLLTWMLMYEPNDRPAICQVLSHVYFWSSDRKWCFILTCAGVPFGSNTSCIDLDELYPLLDQTAINYDIKGSWVVVVKKTFPNLNPMMDDDTPTGLLRFIKSYYDKRISLDIEPSMFRSFILTSFPVLPLSLYRMLQPTTWMKHPAFIHFSAIG